MDAQTQSQLIQLLIFALTQLVIAAVFLLRIRSLGKKQQADAKIAKQERDDALEQQGADLRKKIADAKTESERRITEAALIREQAHRDEQKARAEIEKQLIDSNNRFADEIKASREAYTKSFDKMTDVLDHISGRQEIAGATHTRNSEKIDALSLDLKEGFDKVDLVQGEHLTQLNTAYTHIGEESQRVIEAVGNSKLEIVTKLTAFDPTAETVKAIEADVTELIKSIKDLQTTYDEAIPKIFDSLSKTETENTNIAESLADLMELVGAISSKVSGTEGSAVRIEEHLQSIQRDLRLKQGEPPLTDDDTAQFFAPILPGSGDVPPQGSD